MLDVCVKIRKIRKYRKANIYRRIETHKTIKNITETHLTPETVDCGHFVESRSNSSRQTPIHVYIIHRDLSTIMLRTVTTWQWFFFLVITIVYENVEINNVKTSLIKTLYVNYVMTFISQYLHRYVEIWYVHKCILFLNLIDSLIYCSKNIELYYFSNI